MTAQRAASPLVRMQPIVHLTLSAKVYQDLRELIISGQLQPGERLTLAGMAKALGTSAMPVREAIQKLAADDALELLPNKSVRVPVMTRTRFRELVTIRLAVEGLAIETAAGLITAGQLDALAQLEHAFRTELQLAMPDVNRIIQVNKQFHFGAYAAAGMQTLRNLIEGLWLRIGPVLNLDLRNGSSRLANPPSVRAHRAMLEALRASDGPAGLDHGHPVRSRRHSFRHWPESRISQLRALFLIFLCHAHHALALPVHVVAAVHAVEHARQHEQQVAQTIQVLARRVFQRLGLAQRDNGAFGAARHGAADMRQRRRARAGRQDEFGQARQLGVVGFEGAVEQRDGFGLEQFIARNRQLAAEVEQLVLHFDQQLANARRHVFAQQHADVRIQLVNVAHRVDPQAVLGNTRVVAQAGGAVVAGPGRDL